MVGKPIPGSVSFLAPPILEIGGRLMLPTSFVIYLVVFLTAS